MFPKLLFALAIASAITAHAENEKPFAAIAGRWKSEATISSLSRDDNLKRFNHSWKGRFYGAIEPTGQLIFKAANGCEITGFATRFASNTLWSVEADLKYCPIEHFNQRLFGNFRREGNSLLFEATESPFAVGKLTVGYLIKATMVRY